MIAVIYKSGYRYCNRFYRLILFYTINVFQRGLIRLPRLGRFYPPVSSCLPVCLAWWHGGGPPHTPGYFLWRFTHTRVDSPKDIVGALRPLTPGILSFVEKKVSKETFPSKISKRFARSASDKLIQTHPFGLQTRINFLSPVAHRQ